MWKCRHKRLCDCSLISEVLLFSTSASWTVQRRFELFYLKGISRWKKPLSTTESNGKTLLVMITKPTFLPCSARFKVSNNFKTGFCGRIIHGLCSAWFECQFLIIKRVIKPTSSIQTKRMNYLRWLRGGRFETFHFRLERTRRAISLRAQS